MKTTFKNSGSPVKPGDLLLTEQPFVFVLSSKEKGSRCDNCLLKGKVLKCSGCQFVHYCGRVCQKEAWNDHKWECNNLKRTVPKVIPDAARMLARIINRLNRNNGTSYRAFYSANSFRMWKDLMSHYSDLKTDKKRMEHIHSLCMVLYEFLKDISLPNTVELMGLYGRMVINSFTILDMEMNSIGTGVYLACSVLDHSCNPNAVATFDGKTITIRATKHMPALDWNQVRISYIDLMKTPYERQSELLENYYFLCQCDRCLDESQLKILYGAKCPNSQCESAVQIEWKTNCILAIRPEKEKEEQRITEDIEVKDHNLCHDTYAATEDHVDHCTECGTKFTDSQISVFTKTMQFTELHLQSMREASVASLDVDVCKYCLDKHEGVLHPLNVMHAQTLDLAFDALIQMQLWRKACDYAKRLIPCFGYYYGEYHPLLGLLHLKYGKILIYLMESQQALEQLKLSEKILKVTHGENHPLYKEELVPLLGEAMMESK